MVTAFIFQAGDSVRFRGYRLGKLENTILEEEGIKKYGWGHFEVIAGGKTGGGDLMIRTSSGEEVSLPALWFVPNDAPQTNE